MTVPRPAPLPGLRIFDAARTLGTRVLGEPGSGKSVLLAASFTFPDFQRGIPTVLVDVNGGLIDTHWALVLAQGRRLAESMMQRIRYVDVGNYTYAYGRPFYYWLPGDDAFAVAQRPLEIFMKLSPALREAPILGESSLRQVGTAVGMLAATMTDGAGGIWQITEALDMLMHYNDPLWKAIMDSAAPAVPDAVRFMRESYAQWDREQQRNRRWAFESRCWPYLSSRVLRATVGQGVPGVAWDDVVREGLCVMLDFRHLQDRARRDELSLLWLQSLIEYFERRGVGHVKPLSLVLDEVPALLENPAMEPEVRRLINRYRAMKVWPVLAHQSLSQLSPALRESAWSFGNQIVGKQLNVDACIEVARNLIAADPYRIKTPAQRDGQMPMMMPVSEQERELAAWLQQRAGRQFLVRRYYDEETPDSAVRFISRTPDVDALQRVTAAQIEAAKEANLKAFARPVEGVLRAIDARLPKRVVPQQERPKL